MRYLLMSTSLTQKFSPTTNMAERLLVGYSVTDEIFGITINRKGFIDPIYNLGALLVAVPGWAFGTSFGIIAGNILPARLVSALAVTLFGMFLAIIIPAAKKDKVVLGIVLVSFIMSFIFDKLINSISNGTKVIILTVLISTIWAILFPVKEVEVSHE